MDLARRRSRSLLASPLALAARLAMDPAPADSQPKIANSTRAMHLHGRNSAMQKSPIAMQNEAKLWAPGIELGSLASHLDTLTG